ncbi:hypothetical protein [Methanothrix sp.]|jgi:hypothetical protein|nr:hypothetical protein [Methanothrix sp.]
MDTLEDLGEVAKEEMFDKKIGSTHIDGSLLHAIDVFENAFMP